MTAGIWRLRNGILNNLPEIAEVEEPETDDAAAGTTAGNKPKNTPAGNNKKLLLGENCNYLGVLAYNAGNYAEALTLFEKALPVYYQCYEEDHQKVATVLSNIAYAYEKLGDNNKALEFHLKALAIREEKLGEHQDTASSCYNAATAYSALGDRAKALEFLRRAVYIAEKTLGAEHQTTLQYKNKLQTLENSEQN